MEIDFLSVSETEREFALSLLDKLGSEKLTKSIYRDYDEGHNAIYRVVTNFETIGLVVCRVELNHESERELVILHTIAAENITIPFYKILGVGLPALAKKYNCPILRHHADRDGMVKMLQSFGYECSEVVFRKRVLNVEDKKHVESD